jgi:cell division protein ZapE
LFLDIKSAEIEFEKFFVTTEKRNLSDNVVQIFDRKLETVRNVERTIWCAYQVICEQFFSYRDYLELLADIDVFLISNVEVKSLDGAKRLGWLVEVIYDSGKALAMSCSLQREDIFSDLEIPEHLRLEFERVISRITELTG